MLKTVSWQQYFVMISLLSVIYYTVAGAFYYKKEILKYILKYNAPREVV